MRWMVVDTVYDGFVRQTYRTRPGLADEDYQTQLAHLIDGAFGASDFYSRHLRASGMQASDVLLNVAPLRNAWRMENGLRPLPDGVSSMLRTLEHQVRATRPDALLVLDMDVVPDALVQHLAALVPTVVGQIAAPIDWRRSFAAYDLVVSSLPPFVARFRSAGVRSELLPLAFEPAMRDRIAVGERDIALSFVGSIDPAHRKGTEVLEALGVELPLDVWAPRSQARHVPKGRSRYHGEAWGADMYRTLARSRVVVNRHIDVAEGYANNLRLYEATGMGACLLTEAAPNLSDLFEPGVQVVPYASARDCVEQARALLEDDERRNAIAAAGQARTLQHHTYAERVAHLLALVEDLPRRNGRTKARAWRSPYLESREAAARTVRTGMRGVLAVRGRLRRGVSSEHERIEPVDSSHELARAWTSPSIGPAQRSLVEEQLAALRRGDVVAEFDVASVALQRTGLDNPLVLDVGCASAYYATALRDLGVPIRYVGVDYSAALLRDARHHESEVAVINADAAQLPIATDGADVVLSGSVLLHMPAWRAGLSESFRVARRFVLLHRTPVTDGAETYLRKRAYGVPVVELVFSQAALLDEVGRLGGRVEHRWVIDRYQLDAVTSPIEMTTYLIAVGASA